MKKLIYYALGLVAILATACSKNNETPIPGPGESTTELLVKKFSSAPIMDGEIDVIWSESQKLTGSVSVPDLPARKVSLNGDGGDEDLGLFYPFSGESYKFSLRSGYFNNDIYFLLEWDDAEDSKDRASWYFDENSKVWKQQHKYANSNDDKFYEDKFGMQFPITNVAGWEAGTCYATCHQGLNVSNHGQKVARHYTSNLGEMTDMWHWKRVRGMFAPYKIDDKNVVYKENAAKESVSGRKADEGTSGYSDNKQKLTITGTTTEVNVPKYVIPGEENYYWITETEINDGTAKLIKAIDENGVLSYDGGTIDPSNGGFESGTGNKRVPSVTIKNFTGSRGDIRIEFSYTGTGWVTEFTRKMNTGNSDDVQFDPIKEIMFGLAIFNNAAIAHGIKPNLKMKFEQ